MLTGDMFDRLPTWGQLGPLATMSLDDVDVFGVRALTGATTTGATDYRLLLSMTGTWALTLGATYAGFRMTLANTGTGVITATPSNGTLAGRASILIYPGETFDAVFDGTNWRCPGRQAVLPLSQTVVSSATAQIDLTRGFLDDPEVTGMRIEYNGLSSSASGVNLNMSGLTPTVVNSDYAYFFGTIGSSPADTAGAANGNALIGNVFTTVGSSGRGVLNVDMSPSGTVLVSGNYVRNAGSSMSIQTIMAHFGVSLSGLRIMPSSGNILTARVMQYGFRGQ